MQDFAWRTLGRLVGGALLFAAAGPLSAATPPREAESFRIGSEGALCEAQGVMLGEARTSVFDRKWALLCADIDRPIGTAFSWKGGNAAMVGRGREVALECDDTMRPAPADGVVARHCREPGSGLAWTSYAMASDGWLHVVEGYAAFDGALRLALASLAENREVPGTVEIVTTGGTGSLAAARAALGDSELLIGQGYRRNNAGDYTEAEEFFRPDLLVQDPAANKAALAERRHEATVNRALQLSNLGRADEAARLFAEARAMGLRDGIQARLLRNFEAIDALNRGELGAVGAILARPVPDIDEAVASEGGVEIGRPLAASLNSGLAAGLTDSVAQETRLTRFERATIIDAQARQLAATVLRLQGRPDEALGELAAARAAVVQVKEGRVLSVARLEAQILSEMALAHEAAERFGEANALLRDALALIELRYPESASVNAAKARLAAYLSRRGQRDQALALYREVVDEVSGERGALVGLENQIRPYFEMLIEDLPNRPALIGDLFTAAQLIERPGAAQTLAQLSRQLSAGTGEAAELFRRANAVDRELARVNLSIAQAGEPDGGTPEALLPELEQRRAQLGQMQLELIDALSAYPAYRSLAHAYVSASDLTALLGPGEGYLKLVRLGDEMYAVYLSRERSTAWKVGASSAEVAELVSALRDSISLAIGGVTATYPFDVDASLALHDALFAPVAGDLARLDHLVFEPDGALLQLPVNLLTGDSAGVAAYHARVEAGGDEFDFRGIGWLGRDKAISTALSPASFRDARHAPPSAAGRAYIGLGENAPVGPVTRASLVRSVESPPDPGCEIPIASWNRPVAADELVAASRVFGPARSDMMTGAAFTDTAIEQRSDLDTFRIVHFATHGLVTAPHEGCAAQPALLTSFGGPGSDGLLQFAEVFELDLDADLVILSACDTASLAGLEATRAAGLESGGGQALDGLVRAFIGAGGRQVIASHWPAPDQFEATTRLFAGFFSTPPATTLGNALLAAQNGLMDDPETSHPFYWSGFALVGDGERPLFSGT